MMELDSRHKIYDLVSSFYTTVKQDALLGPIFNSQIDDWSTHMDRLTDFWETNLLFVPRYRGNAADIHVEVDKAYNHGITQLHFERWLSIWIKTIDESYTGLNAERAKMRARKMSTHMFIKIFQQRK